jgi:hypothetical protein
MVQAVHLRLERQIELCGYDLDAVAIEYEDDQFDWRLELAGHGHLLGATDRAYASCGVHVDGAAYTLARRSSLPTLICDVPRLEWSGDLKTFGDGMKPVAVAMGGFKARVVSMSIVIRDKGGKETSETFEWRGAPAETTDAGHVTSRVTSLRTSMPSCGKGRRPCSTQWATTRIFGPVWMRRVPLHAEILPPPATDGDWRADAADAARADRAWFAAIVGSATDPAYLRYLLLEQGESAPEGSPGTVLTEWSGTKHLNYGAGPAFTGNLANDRVAFIARVMQTCRA